MNRWEWAVPFNLEVALPLEECIERLDESVNEQYRYIIKQPKKPPLILTPLNDNIYEFSFSKLANRNWQALTYIGVLERKHAYLTIVTGTARVHKITLFVFFYAAFWATIFLQIPVLGFFPFIAAVAVGSGIMKTRKQAGELLSEMLQIEGKKK
ncbi:MAG: hypothetical protein H7175_15540 [Burkholderiales bacterium]|nr:hypothetical protein [Anaerolineae bacterium]